MKLLDTMVLVSAMNPGSKYHKTGMTYLRGLRAYEATHIPTSTLIEFDLVMRNNGYTESEIADTWTALAPFVERKFVATTPSALSGYRNEGKGVDVFRLVDHGTCQGNERHRHNQRRRDIKTRTHRMGTKVGI